MNSTKKNAIVFLFTGQGSQYSGMGKMCRGGDKSVWLPSMRRNSDENRLLLESLGRLYTLGKNIDWRAVHEDTSSRRISLPAYPFEQSRY